MYIRIEQRGGATCGDHGGCLLRKQSGHGMLAVAFWTPATFGRDRRSPVQSESSVWRNDRFVPRMTLTYTRPATAASDAFSRSGPPADARQATPKQTSGTIVKGNVSWTNQARYSPRSTWR